MFHPLVFDNIRVVLEGAVYDRDFEGAITITNRSDVMDMATFHRQFQIEFKLADQHEHTTAVRAEMQLRTQLADIAAEQLEQPLTDHIGCTICIHFSCRWRITEMCPPKREKSHRFSMTSGGSDRILHRKYRQS